MNTPRPITIAGGGLAGLTLGIALRRNQIPVTIWEAGNYPRHRVCGEFISGRGTDILDNLGLLEKAVSAGARFATTASFFSEHKMFPQKVLPKPALCFSRFELDRLLAQEFQQSGGELKVNSRWTGNFTEPGIIRANGRRIHPAGNGWRWFGLKIHARNIQLQTDLEMHLRPNGYVGLCRLGSETVNLCGLFRSKTALPDLRDWRKMFRGAEDSILAARLAGATFDESSLCSVAGFSFEPQDLSCSEECSLGDSLTMIAPLTGNGMSLAFESAALAVSPLEQFSRHQFSWDETRRKIASQYQDTFQQRLWWAKWLQRALLQPASQQGFLTISGASERLWNFFFLKTR